MPVTQADIDALNAAIATGERQTVISGESVTYRSVEEMIAARSDFQRQFNAAEATASTPGRRPSRRSLFRFAGRGYNDDCC